MTFVEFRPVLDTPEDVARAVREFQAAYADAGAEGLVKTWQARIDATTEHTLNDAHTPLD